MLVETQHYRSGILAEPVLFKLNIKSYFQFCQLWESDVQMAFRHSVNSNICEKWGLGGGGAEGAA